MTVLAAILGIRLLAAATGPADGLPVPSPVSVVVDAAVVDGEALAARLVAGVAPLARLLPPGPGAAVSIHVTGELLDFHVGLGLGSADESSWSRCPCTHAELVAHAQQRLTQALRPRSRRPLPPRVAVPPPPPLPTPPRVVVPRRSLGRPGRLGVALVALGGLVLGAGTGMVATAFVDERWASGSHSRPHGLVAMTVGTSVLATGAFLLIFDRRLFRARLRAAHP